MKKLFLGLSSCVLLVLSGCMETISTTPSAAESETPQVESKESESDAAGTSEEGAAPEDEYEMKQAGVGATGKGEYGVTSEQPMSIITTPVSAYFHAQEMSVFNIQIPQALSLFQASEGRFPNSEQEFMEKIIKANAIVLPKLPDGDSYVYDVQSHTLMIRTKKPQ